MLTDAIVSTWAMARNSGFFVSTEEVSGTTMQPRSIRARRSAIALGEKSLSRLTTVPGATEASARERPQRATASARKPYPKIWSRQTTASLA